MVSRAYHNTCSTSVAPSEGSLVSRAYHNTLSISVAPFKESLVTIQTTEPAIIWLCIKYGFQKIIRPDINMCEECYKVQEKPF